MLLPYCPHFFPRPRTIVTIEDVTLVIEMIMTSHVVTRVVVGCHSN